MTDANAREGPPPDAKLNVPENLPTVYANLISVTGSMHDVRLTLGRHAPGGGGSFELAVYLSYPAAKQMVDLIQGILGSYEETFGPIHLEPAKK